MPVILFHAGFAAFAGGFVGVDVFFVISGYLIASIIVEEMRGGRFSFGQFFEQRAAHHPCVVRRDRRHDPAR